MNKVLGVLALIAFSSIALAADHDDTLFKHFSGKWSGHAILFTDNPSEFFSCTITLKFNKISVDILSVERNFSCPGKLADPKTINNLKVSDGRIDWGDGGSWDPDGRAIRYRVDGSYSQFAESYRYFKPQYKDSVMNLEFSYDGYKIFGVVEKRN